MHSLLQQGKKKKLFGRAGKKKDDLSGSHISNTKRPCIEAVDQDTLSFSISTREYVCVYRYAENRQPTYTQLHNILNIRPNLTHPTGGLAHCSNAGPRLE
jgi:hypothetical protein